MRKNAFLLAILLATRVGSSITPPLAKLAFLSAQISMRGTIHAYLCPNVFLSPHFRSVPLHLPLLTQVSHLALMTLLALPPSFLHFQPFHLSQMKGVMMTSLSALPQLLNRFLSLL